MPGLSGVTQTSTIRWVTTMELPIVIPNLHGILQWNWKNDIHPSRQFNHILPSAKGNQWCYACINHRTIKTTKAYKYCTWFQKSKQRGSFQGIGTCSIICFGDMRFTSVLLDESESISVKMIPDIISLLSKLQRERYISIYSVNTMRAQAKFIHPD